MHAARPAPYPVRGVVATGATLAGAAVYVGMVEPGRGGWLPPCPLHAATGLWCPGCGLTRATHHLLRGDVAAALGANLLVPLVLAAIALGWWATLAVSLGRPAPTWARRVPAGVWAALAVAVGTFTVLRNLAAFDALAP